MSNPASAKSKSHARGRKPDPAKNESILDAARELFLDKGYGASIDEIAERAGVVKQTVYARFKSKEELFIAVVRATAEDLLTPISKAPAGRPRETLLAFGEQYHRMLLEPRRIQMAQLMIAQASQFPDLSRRFFEGGPSYVHGQIAAYLAREAAAGALNLDDAGIAASQFLGMIKGIEHLGALLGVDAAESELQRRRRIVAAVEAFLRVYAP